MMTMLLLNIIRGIVYVYSSPFLQKTNVYIFINVKDNEYQKFIIGSEAKSETFCVTNNESKYKLKMDDNKFSFVYFFK
jgi:predicted acetyltransferase